MTFAVCIKFTYETDPMKRPRINLITIALLVLLLLLVHVQIVESYVVSLVRPDSQTKFGRTLGCLMVSKNVKPPTPEPLRSQENSTDLLYAASILDDGKGHINRDLAESIYSWEQARREKSHLPRFDFSTRQGLRLVDEIARELLADWWNEQQKQNDSADPSVHDASVVDATYSDLLQDGVVALMQAMGQYDGPSEEFQQYARESITQQLSRALAKQASPFRWPEKVVRTWRAAQLERGQFILEMGREPTSSELAQRLNITTQQLEVNQQLSNEVISMESTVEIYDPLLEASAKFADQDDWEHQQGLLLDHGDRVLTNELLEEYVDKAMQYEGEDEMWVHHEQIAAPLRELIPDGEADPDDIVLSEMLRLGVNDLVERTLDRKEKQIVRLRYGLGSTPTMSQREVANLWGVPLDMVRRLEHRALRKLRESYQNRYVDMDDDESTEDSV
jgi:RNA polymerase sigma factor (sigma-70 family)